MNDFKRTDLYGQLLEATAARPVNRKNYCEAHDMTAEEFRDTLATLRDMGIRVVSHTNGRGYWIARTSQEYVEWRDREWAKMIKKMARIKQMDQNLPGQQEVPTDDLLQ